MNPTNGLLAEEVIEEGNLMKKIAVLDVNGTIQDTGEYYHLFFLQEDTIIKRF